LSNFDPVKEALFIKQQTSGHLIDEM
jgi:hypothetical protein